MSGRSNLPATPTVEQWTRLLDDVELPTHSEVSQRLEDRMGASPVEARAIVDDALDAGMLDVDASGTWECLIPAGHDQDGEDDHDQDHRWDLDADVLDAFEVAVEFFHNCLDHELPDHAEHDTAHEYFTEARGWDAETIEDKRLGYAPANDTALLDRLMADGFDRDAILGTGLFYEGLTPHFRGRFMFPYFDADGRPCYAISRSIGADDGGHPIDPKGAQKYTKAVKRKEYSQVDEPIYGLETIRKGEPVLITEGIADAITAHEAGYPCLSPVTTQFKRQDRERLADELGERDVPRVYIVQDAERPGSSLDENGELTITQFGEGVRGAVATGDELADHGIDARIGDLPRLGLEKVDLDDYLQRWTDGDLTPVLASATPAEEHPAHDPKRLAIEEANEYDPALRAAADADRSGVFDLDIRDVTGLSWDYRGVNPLGHHGESEDYFQLIREHGIGYDHKYQVGYSPLAYLLCDAGERPASSPGGSLSEWETFVAWRHATEQGLLPTGDPIPRNALVGVALDTGICEREEIVDEWKLPIEAYNATLEHVRDEYGLDPGRELLSSGGADGNATRFCEECEPPITADADPLDVTARRDAMTGDRYDAFVARDDGLTVWAYNPGEGKTTCSAIAAAQRDREHVMLLPKHENCREFQRDDEKPDGYFHLKGAAQPIGDPCMDASIEDAECPDHGHPSNCPSMCPVYDLDADHELRQAFDVLAANCGVQKAHTILGVHTEDWHGETCDWQAQWDTLDSADRVVTVTNYLTLKSIREHGDILLDDAAGITETTTVEIEQLSRCRQACRRYAELGGDDATADTFAVLVEFIDDVLDALTDGVGALDAVPEPEFPSVTENYDARRRRYVGEGGQYVYDDNLAERLAQAKLFYEESVVNKFRRGEWDGTPLCLDTIFGAIAAVTDDPDTAQDARIAAGVDASLEECPRCHEQLQARQGARFCPECGWNERNDRLTQDHDRSAPARIDTNVATAADGTIVGLATRRLPPLDRLPDPSTVLVLDATPRPAVYAAMFGLDAGTDAVTLEGDDAYALPNATGTQFINGAYHRSTIEQSAPARRYLQRSIDRIDAMHERVIYVTLKRVEQLIEWPDGAEVLNYYALRGLDRPDADAVVCVGAPHPNEDDLRAEARALAVGAPGIHAGGRELSTRSPDPADPTDDVGDPVYRPVNYVDDDGRGREVATKTYTGLTGELFDGRHTDEIEQAAHRHRPLLAAADDEKHVYLLTNVPTKLPIDRLTSYGGFLDPVGTHVDVRDSALDLLDIMVDEAQAESDADYAADGGTFSIGATVAEWHEAAQSGGLDVTKRTIRNALDDLTDTGLVEDGAYIQDRGRVRTLTELGAMVAAR